MENLNKEINRHFHNQHDSQLRNKLCSRNQIDGKLRSQLDSQLINQLESQLYSELGMQIYRQLITQFKHEKFK
jgi:hypothetical protein